MPRRAARIDDNQPTIVAMFRSLGYSVAHTHMVGDGFPDVVVAKFGRDFLIEIKDGSKPPSARKLTEDEEKFHSTWKGHIEIIETVDDVFRFDRSVRKGEL